MWLLNDQKPLFMNFSRPPLSNRCNGFYLIESKWMESWRNYIKDVNTERPKPISNKSLRCKHNKVLMPDVYWKIEEGIAPKDHMGTFRGDLLGELQDCSTIDEICPLAEIIHEVK
jgi:hypothetical protein